MTTYNQNDIIIQSVLHLAIELSNSKWKLGFTPSFGQKPREKSIDAGDFESLKAEIFKAKERFNLPSDTPVVSCYEAGRDGFYIHRFLESIGVKNIVIEPASIEVNRRAKRAKTDKLDLEKMLTMLIRYQMGEKKVFAVVNVPSVKEEDARQMHRDLKTLKNEKTRITNRIKSLFATQGIRKIIINEEFPLFLDEVRLWNGSLLPEQLKARLLREFGKWQFIHNQIHDLEEERKEIIFASNDPAIEKVRKLLKIKGIGENSATLFVLEFFGWRNFKNRKEIAALAGLTPTPYQSGDMNKDLGISKSGNRHIRSMVIDIAWGWIRFQPQSTLTIWFNKRFATGGKRSRKIGIVAVARKLLIALWRYLENGQIPEGAIVEC